MIQTKTVFVLGAGASMPYGFPSGAQLRTEIVSAQHETHWLAQHLIHEIDLDWSEVRDFARAFYLSGVTSIDSFLTTRPEFVEIGKVAIASCLCRLEQRDWLESEDDKDHKGRDKDHWYRLLWNSMVADTNKLEEVRQNQVKFITFNYDRSLEAYLHQTAKYRHGCSDDQALKYVKDLGVLHVYGQLGAFHYLPGDTRRDYETTVDQKRIEIAAAGIHIMPESRGDAAFEEARTMFDWASTICFLGFGFDPLNVERLGLEDALLTRKKVARLPRIVASLYGRTQAEEQWIKGTLCPSADDWHPHDEKNTMTLRKTGVLLA